MDNDNTNENLDGYEELLSDEDFAKQFNESSFGEISNDDNDDDNTSNTGDANDLDNNTDDDNDATSDVDNADNSVDNVTNDDENLNNANDNENNKQPLEQPASNADTGDSNTTEDVKNTTDDDKKAPSSESIPADTNSKEQVQDNISTEAKSTPTTNTDVYKIKADGMDFEFSLDDLKNLAPKAINYTRKSQGIKPHLELISQIEEAGLKKADIDLLISAHKGDKGAIVELLKQNELDIMDIDVDKSTYVPVSYGKSAEELEVIDTYSDILKDTNGKKTSEIIEKVWDTSSRNAMFENPQIMKALHTDVKTGVYDRIEPIAVKLKTLDNAKKSDLEYYKEAAFAYNINNKQQVSTPVNNSTATNVNQVKSTTDNKDNDKEVIAKVKAQQKARQSAKITATKRRAAGVTTVRNKSQSITPASEIDTLSDDAFSEMMAKRLL